MNSMRTAIVTDSNSGIMADKAAAMHVFIVPMPVLMNGEVYYEGKDLGHAAFFNALTSGYEISTSMPSPSDVIEMWDRVLNIEGYDELVYIPMSSGLSSSYATAQCLAEDYQGRVHVVDAHRISVTLCSAISYAVKLNYSGLTAKEIAKAIEANAFNSSIYLAVDNMRYLTKGGRITKSAAALGSLLHVKPILTIQGQQIEPFAKGHGMKSAVRSMIHALHEDIDTRFDGDESSVSIGVAVADIPDEELALLLCRLQDEFPTAYTFSARLPFSICVHTGPGAIGFGIARD